MENIEVPTLFEDFEEGDRIYGKYGLGLSLGTVISATEDFLEVFYDYVGETGFLSAAEVSKPKQGIYGKPLALDLVQKGSVISCIKDGKRIYADVVEFRPEKKLRYKFQGQDEVSVVLQSSYRPTIEKQMVGWDLEA